MIRVKKKQEAAIVEAYCLGEENEVLNRLMEEGKLVEKAPGVFEVFSQEAVNGKGEIAHTGDFIKIDASGFPYFNQAEYFRKKHRSLGGNKYLQSTSPYDAWTVEEDMCEEIDYLIKEKGLVIDESSEERYFSAPLDGTIVSAARDAVIMFYEIVRDDNGKIQDVNFHFVKRDIFDETYDILEEG